MSSEPAPAHYAACVIDVDGAFERPARTRRDQIVRARELLLGLRPPDTPVVVGRNIGRDGEDLTVTTLAALEPDSIDMSCLLIIGSSQTRLSGGSTVWTSRSVTQLQGQTTAGSSVT